MYSIADFQVGDKVLFGRGRGEQTRGTVVKVNRARLKVRQDESRGSSRSYPVGSVWTVPPSLCRPLNGAAPSKPVAPKPKPAPRGSDAATFAMVAKRNGFDIGLLGQRVKVGGSTMTIVGSKPRDPFIGEGVRGGRYKLTATQVRYGLVSAEPPEPPAKRPEAEIMADICGVYDGLSPENLSWDGERSRSQIKRAGAALRRKLRALETELGRKVSESEAYASWER